MVNVYQMDYALATEIILELTAHKSWIYYLLIKILRKALWWMELNGNTLDWMTMIMTYLMIITMNLFSAHKDQWIFLSIEATILSQPNLRMICNLMNKNT